MGANLTSPNTIARPCDLDDLPGWYAAEVAAVGPEPVRDALMLVGTHLPAFVRFPARAVLLWHGCDRVVPDGKRTKYHTYPAALKAHAKRAGVTLDARANGPAAVAFQIAGGERPPRFGSANAWSVHHLYSGKFPYPGRAGSTHAAKRGEHFTQSAGLVAVHPIADAACDESPALTWLLRAAAFLRSGYDPDGVFAASRDGFGFADGAPCEVLCADT